jgi:EAL domain-containing protein (putative c-di-GMP-specific phosphodiesterase class I)
VLIDHLDGNPERAALVRATIEMAHALGVEVVAEGVEREAERDLLATLGCRYAQGFLFGRPVPAMEFPIPEQLRTRAVLLDRDPAR